MRNERAWASVDMAVIDVWQRELGGLSNRKFACRLAASEDLVLRLDIFKELGKHGGFVPTLSFNADGNILVSGSHEPWSRVILWDWENGVAKLTFESGHRCVNKNFQAKFMPYSDDRSLITCAVDGQVRHAQILERGVETKLLAKHQGPAYKVVVEPGNPHTFYSCGADGVVNHIDLRTAATAAATELFRCRPIDHSSPYKALPLLAFAIDPKNPNLFAVAGSDKYTRLYDIRKYKWDGSTDFGQPMNYFHPSHLIGNHSVAVTDLAFSDQSELLISYSDNSIYLFTREMGLDISATSASAKEVDENYKGHGTSEIVKSVSFFGPKSEYVVSGSGFGRIYIWKKKGGELVRVMKADKHMIKCIESHTQHTTVLASCGTQGIKIWTPKAIDKPMHPTNIEEEEPEPDLEEESSDDDIGMSLFSFPQ